LRTQFARTLSEHKNKVPYNIDHHHKRLLGLRIVLHEHESVREVELELPGLAFRRLVLGLVVRIIVVRRQVGGLNVFRLLDTLFSLELSLGGCTQRNGLGKLGGYTQLSARWHSSQ